MNPEFRRNLWLELTVHRMVAMPVVLGLVFALVYAASDADPRASLALAAALIAAGLTGLWGARNAADSVPEEVRGRTWDAQRMSAIDPWAMTWGKLLGATAFAWYGGLMALAVLVLAAPRDWTHSSAKIAALIVAASVLAQGVGAIAGLMVARKGPARQGAASSLVLLLVILLLGPGLGVFASLEQPVTWWGRDYGLVDFSLASAAVFALWALAGVYRMMCAELQVRTTPWVLAAFVLFVTGYVAGFMVPPGAGLVRSRDALLVSGLLLSGVVTYLMLFSEQTSVVVLRRVQVRLARGELRRAMEELPGWPASLALAGAFCSLGVVFLGGDGRAAGRDLLPQLSLAPLPLFLLLARDAAIYLIFAFARRPRRVEAAAAFYLVLLYVVLPWLLHAAGLTALAELVLPPVFTRPGYAAAVAAAQAAIAAGFAAWRWRAHRVQETEA
jgi:hypothetical protein